MPPPHTRNLPLPLRTVARLGPGRPWDAIGHGLASRRLRDDTAYRGARGFSLSIDPADRFQRMMLLGWYDPLMEAMFRPHLRPGGVVIDAGAHLGYFTLQFAAAVGPGGQVHSFECDPRLISKLRANVEQNAFSWVRVNQAAVHERSGRPLTFHMPDQLGWGSVEADEWNAPSDTGVTSIALDDYLEANRIEAEELSLVKLDVEGAERPALAGMSETLARTSAAVLVELVPWRLEHQGRSVEELVEFMRSRGYEPWSPHAMRRGTVDLRPGAEPAIGEDVLFLKP